MKDFIVAMLYCLDLKDPEHIRAVEGEISVKEVAKDGRQFIKTNAACLLADRLSDDALTIANNLIPIMKMEDFVIQATADSDGMLTIEIDNS